MTAVASSEYLVVPGQVIATSSEDDDTSEGFLRGHGTYIEKMQSESRLVASVAGTVERVNKLISVLPISSSTYMGHVGDLVVGRICGVGPNRWKVKLGGGASKDAQLPLSGVHLPGGVQRVRTAEDARDMRQFFAEGDLVSAEVNSLHHDGTLVLHTRSLRYGKLENGCLVVVPPALIPRQKNHYIVALLGMVDVLWGTNGYIWIQRTLPQAPQEDNKEAPLAEIQEKLRRQHAATPVLPDERQTIARLANSIECLRMVYSMVTPEAVETVYKESLKQNTKVYDMLRPDVAISLTASFREEK